MLARLAAAAGRRAARSLSLATAAAPSPRPGLVAPASPFLPTAARRSPLLPTAARGFSSAPPPDLTPAQLFLYTLLVEQEAAHAKRVQLLRQENCRLADAIAKFAMDIEISRARASAGEETAAYRAALGALVVACLSLIFLTVGSAKRAALYNKEAASLEKESTLGEEAASSLEGKVPTVEETGKGV
ncbi:unnamed protein product [Urochloa humidicola]